MVVSGEVAEAAAIMRRNLGPEVGEGRVACSHILGTADEVILWCGLVMIMVKTPLP